MNINKFMDLYGRSVCLTDGDAWTSETFHAFIQPLRYKNKMYLYGIDTQIGFNAQGHYLYIGPPEHDLTAVQDSDFMIESGDVRYRIDRAEKVYCGESVFYVWAIIRTVVEDESDE